MEQRFQNRSIIVTGAASGIGLAAAKRFAAEGGKVLLADLNYEGAMQAAAELRQAGAEDAMAVRCDVSEERDVLSAVELCIAKFGSLDVIVNNAGLMIFKRIEEQSEEDWVRILRVDLLGAVFFTKQAFLKMKPGGAIVNVSSIHAVETQPLVSSYAAAKAALLSLTRSSALEGKPKGIRVNAVLPGAIDTPMLWNNPNVKAGLEHIERTDVGKPEELAAVIAFLASSDASFVQGASVIADGGRLGLL
jgi:NAD(P)-dependent dehydrogenase (short-subunit alcohol dehydrogenase family)